MLGTTLAYTTTARGASLAALASLVISPTAIATGSAATGTVTLDGIPTKLTTVNLTSGNTQLVTVPSSVTVLSPKMLNSFQVQSVSGAAGCTSVTARLGTVAKAKMIHVLPPASGAPVKLTVPEVAVTATLSEVGVVGAATFPISTTVGGAETCAVISATRSGTTARGLIKLMPISG